jgi:nucleotide-binding universal stress UspA family protein
MSTTILVGAHLEHADGDPIGLAVELARPLGAKLVLGAVHVPSGAEGDSQARERLVAEVAELRSAVPSEVPARTEIMDSTSVVRGLHELAVATTSELLVLGAHHRGILERAIRGDTAADVAFTAPCGVVVAQPADRSGPPRRIGVAWDQTPPADEALEWAIRFVELTNGELHILRVLDPRHREGTHPGVHDRVRLSAAEEEAALRVQSRAQVLWGDPVPELVKASHELDLLVMGSRVHGPVRRMLFGSTSTRVLHEAHCPVVIMPEGVHSNSERATA